MVRGALLLLLLFAGALACARPFDPDPFSVEEVFASRDGARLYTTGSFAPNDEHRATQSGAAAALFLVDPASGRPALERAYEVGELRLRAALGRVLVASRGADLVLLERDSFLPDQEVVATLPLDSDGTTLAGLALGLVKPLDDEQALVSLVRTGTDDAVKGRSLLLTVPASGAPTLAPAPAPLAETGCTAVVHHPPFLSCFASASVPLAEGGTQLMGKLVVMREGAGSFSQMSHAHTELGDPAAPFDGPRATSHFLFPWGGVVTDDGRVRVLESSGGVVTFTVEPGGQLTYQRSELSTQGPQSLLPLGGGKSLVLFGPGVGLFDDQPGPGLTEVTRRTQAAAADDGRSVGCARLGGVALRSVGSGRVAVAQVTAGLVLLDVGSRVEVRGGAFRKWEVRPGPFQVDAELTGQYLDDRDPPAAACLDP